MNKIVFCVAMGLIFTSIASSCEREDGTYKVSIFSTNDVHGKYFDSLYNGAANATSLANVAAYFKEQEQLLGEEGIIRIDVGDFLQGDNAAYWSNYVDTVSSGKHLAVRLFEYLKYDAIVVGNHDIETGHEVYDRINREFRYGYLGANVVNESDSLQYFVPYRIIEKSELRVAVIGFENPNIKSWLGENLWKGVDFLDIKSVAQKWVDYVNSKESPDITIVAMHSGVGNGVDSDFENTALFLSRTLKGVDAIFCGHDHKEFISDSNGAIPVIDARNQCAFVGRCDFEVEIKGGKVVSKQCKASLADMKEYSPDKEYCAEFKDYWRNVYAFSNMEIANAEKSIVCQDALFGPSMIMGLIHSVQMQASGADISFAARLKMYGKVKAGKITYQDLFTIYPFENQLYVIELSGKQIKDYLEYSYMLWLGEAPCVNGHLLNIERDESGTNKGKWKTVTPPFNWESAYGINYSVNIFKPYGQRISIESKSNGEAFDMERIYKVAVSSYRANGGGEHLTKGAGIEKELLPTIVSAKLGDIRGMIYQSLKNGLNCNGTIDDNWGFKPAIDAEKMGFQDSMLMFGK